MAVIEIAGRRIELRHPDKIYFPDPGLTKRQVMEHYARVGPAMVRHTRRRALVLRRFPDGIDHEGFFQKRVAAYFPDWIGRAALPTREGTLVYATGDDPAAIVWLAGIGTIEFHAMLSRVDRPDRPDRIVFDIDPPDDYCDDVRRAALALKAICDELGLASFVKSTGSRGFHVIVPILREQGFDETRAFARSLAARLVAAAPERYSLEMRRARRRGRILIDVWRNASGQTAVAPFSLRARPGAPVAVPLAWSDLAEPGFHPRSVTLPDIARDPARWIGRWPATLGPARSIRGRRPGP
ncbi:MAG: ATP-dependent DNA ligase [Alphaproteobacteria bacterium]|nr:MAG: ATP-dependent DNA ligase [Alphaproteobacteria bacterium]